MDTTICPNCRGTLQRCNDGGCGQRQAPGWRTDENIAYEIRFADMMMGELLSRGTSIETHYVDGVSGFTACELGSIDPADEITGEWDAVTCGACKARKPGDPNECPMTGMDISECTGVGCECDPMGWNYNA